MTRMIFKKPFWMLGFALTLSACSTTVISPPREMRQQLKQNLPLQTLLGSEGKLAENLDLAQARKLAIQGNPDITAARSRIERAKAVVEQANAAFYPTVSAQAGVRHQHLTPRNIFGTLEAYDNYTVGLSASWLVYDGLIRESRHLAARYEALSAEQQLQNTRRLLVDAVSSAYYQSVLAHKQMAINLELQKINEDFLADARDKFSAGSAARSEVNNFLVNVNDSRIAYLDSKNSFETSKLALAELLGMSGADTSAFAPQDLKNDAEVPELQYALKRALSNRPDLKSLQADILATQARIAEAKGEYSPTISVDAAAGLSSIDRLGFGDDDRDASLALNMNWNLFTGNSTRALIAQRNAERESQLAQLKSQWQQIHGEIRQQRQSLLNTLDKLAVQKRSVELNKNIYDDTREIYDRGATSITRVNEVLSNYTVSRLNQALFEIEALRRREILRALMGINDF